MRMLQRHGEFPLRRTSPEGTSGQGEVSLRTLLDTAPRSCTPGGAPSPLWRLRPALLLAVLAVGAASTLGLARRGMATLGLPLAGALVSAMAWVTATSTRRLRVPART
ncbi:hypothetical protein [Amycolatopsis sp. CA-230715]|uniref:hypothetical protein n=1 Tax=Amycolatopsis sp. CA-230715 TaxID=2745196 RepID=UPI001C00B0A2|nr:hypothetical protein [Amycolatopsis sp. CA-230715]QWF81097.1 hypothetical protein HUW46_04523 [Amycolatopsis sp. CA-230715]